MDYQIMSNTEKLCTTEKENKLTWSESEAVNAIKQNDINKNITITKEDLCNVIEALQQNKTFFQNKIYMKTTNIGRAIQQALCMDKIDGIIWAKTCKKIQEQTWIVLDWGTKKNESNKVEPNFEELVKKYPILRQFESLVKKYEKFVKPDRTKCYLKDSEYLSMLQDIQEQIRPWDVNIPKMFLWWFMQVESGWYTHPEQRFGRKEWTDKWPFQIKKWIAIDTKMPYKPYSPLYSAITAWLYLKQQDWKINRSGINRIGGMIACYNMWPTWASEAWKYDNLSPITKKYITNVTYQTQYYEQNNKIDTA